MVFVLIAILLLGILITVHEFGHFLTARACGIAVREYAIGFGPRLLHRTMKSGCEFSLRLLPLGGYCAFYGEDSTDPRDQEDPRAFSRQKIWKRMLTVLMGPGMNFLLAFLVLFFYVWTCGTTATVPVVTAVEAGGPAESAGLAAGDQILAVAGLSTVDRELTFLTDTLSSAQDAQAPRAVELQVRRGEDTLTLSLTPFYDTDLSRYRVGISVGLGPYAEKDASGAWRTVSRGVYPHQAAAMAWNNCTYAATSMLTALKNLISRGEGLENTSGPVGIISLVSSEVRTGGLDAFLNLLIMISINLGIMNLLPIPGLDGSRVLFLLLEAVRRKPIPPEKEAMVHLAGFVLLFGLMLFFTYRDIMKLIG